MYQYFISLHGWIIFQWTAMPSFIYAFLYINKTFGLLWITLLCMFMYKFLREHVFTLLGIYLGVGLLGHMVTICLIFWSQDVSQSSCTITFFARASEGSQFSTSLSTLMIFSLLQPSQWGWGGISLCLSFVFSWWLIVSIFSCAYWPPVYLL